MTAQRCPFRAGEPLSPEVFRRVQRRAAFECFKWDDQSGDEGRLCPFPLLVPESAWRALATTAEALAREALDAEAELLLRPELHGQLGLSDALRECLAEARRKGLTPGAVRFTRFDFHVTPEGLRISEGNADVASGFVEASGFTRLMAEHAPGARLAGDPAATLATAMRDAVGPGRLIALMHLTAYSDVRQIMRYLASRMEAEGLRTCLVSPMQISLQDGRAQVDTEWLFESADLVFRFVPASWLPRLPEASGWRAFLVGGCTEICNPGYAVLTQSKRFGLTWERLSTPLPTWRALLPETRDPGEVSPGDAAWVVKPAFGFEGVDVGLPGATPEAELAALWRSARERPSGWAAQRRFDVLPLDTPLGPMFVCIGVYVVGARAAGAFARLSRTPLIDSMAREAAVLVVQDSDGPPAELRKEPSA